MNSLKIENSKLFTEYETIIKNATQKKSPRSKPLTKFIDDFISLFTTNEEKKKIKEFTYQIDSSIITLYRMKKIVLDEIDVSYTLSSHLFVLTTERAKLYYEAIKRIEGYYEDQSIPKYLKEYKNL